VREAMMIYISSRYLRDWTETYSTTA